jgi:hypothetical protein
MPRAGERHNLRSNLGIAAEEDLKEQFMAFANFGVHGSTVTDMDGLHFAKYCSDCNLIGRGQWTFGRKTLTVTDVDLAFAKVKAKRARRITFDEFLMALNILAEKQAMSVADIVAHCLRCVAPTTNATSVAEDVRLHDDKVCHSHHYQNQMYNSVHLDIPASLSCLQLGKDLSRSRSLVAYPES